MNVMLSPQSLLFILFLVFSDVQQKRLRGLMRTRATAVKASISAWAVRPPWVWDWLYWLAPLKISSSLVDLSLKVSQSGLSFSSLPLGMHVLKHLGHCVRSTSRHVGKLKCLTRTGSQKLSTNLSENSFWRQSDVCVSVWTEVKYAAENWSETTWFSLSSLRRQLPHPYPPASIGCCRQAGPARWRGHPDVCCREAFSLSLSP